MGSKFDNLRQKAISLLKEQSVDTSQWGNDVTHLLEELSIYQIELEHQNEILLQSQHQLQELSDQYSDLFENAPISLMIVDSEGLITKCNNTFHKVFSYTKEDILKHRLSEFVAPAYQDLFYHFFRSICKGIPSAQLELKMVSGLQNEIFVKIEVTFVKGDNKLRFALTDITRQKNLELKLQVETEKLRHGEKRFRHIVERIQGTFFCQDIASKRIVYVSSQVKKLFGVSSEEVLRFSEEEILSYFLVESVRGEYEKLLAELKNLLGENKTVERVFRIRTRSGARRWVLGIFALDCDGEPKTGQLLGSLLDVTQHKEHQIELMEARARAEAQAQESVRALEHFKFAFDLVQIAPFECDAHGYPLSPEKPLPYWPSENGVRVPTEKWIHPADLQRVLKSWEKLCSGEEKTLRHTYRSLYQGKVRHFSVVAQLRHLELGRKSLVHGVVQEITGDVALREEFEITNNLWKTFTDSLPICFYVKDPAHDFCYLQVNEAFADFFQKDLSEIIGKRDEDIFPPEIAASFRQQDELLLTATDPQSFNVTLKDGEGNVHYIHSIRKSFVGADGRRFHLGVSMDVTPQEEVKRKESESRALLQTLLDHFPVCVAVKDADNDFRYILANPLYQSLVGRTAEELYGKNNQQLHIIPDKEMVHLLEDQESIRTGKIFHATEEIWLPQRGRVVYEKTKIPLRLENGRNLILIVATDVTHLNNLVESERITNTSLATVARETDLTKSLDKMAEALQHQVDCDRIVLCKYEGNSNSIELYRDWNQEEIISVQVNNLSASHQLWNSLLDRFKNNEVVTISDIEAQGYQEVCHRLGTRSFIAAPIFVEEEFWGMLLVAFVKKQRIFSEIDERILRSSANIISLALYRKRQILALEKSSDEKRIILNNIRIPIWLCDEKGGLIRANTAACNLGRISEEKMREVPCNLIYCGEEKVPPWCPKLRALKSGKASQGEIKLLGKAYICRAEPILNEKGAVSSVVVSAMDVSEVNEKRQSLQSYLSQQEILNYNLELIMLEESQEKALAILLKLVCSYLKASRCYVNRYDFSQEKAYLFHEYCGNKKPFGDILLPGKGLDLDQEWMKKFLDRKMVAIEDLGKTLQEEGQWSGDMFDEYIQKVKSIYAVGIYDSGKLWGALGVTFEEQCRKLKDAEVKFLQSVAHIIEILQQRFKNKAQLLDALERAQTADKAKSFFIASVSHEIRTPLNAVIGFSELLQSFDLSKEVQNDYLSSIAHSSKALLQIINDVLDLSKLQAGKMVIAQERTNFHLLCREVASIFRLQVREKNLEIKLDLDPIPVVSIDRLRFRQILFNLIGNAVKFTEKGSITLRASFDEKSKEKGILRLSVSDTGCGISQENIEKLAKPFVQVGGVRGSHASNNGTGLGLAICRGMIESMGGQFIIESQLEVGSCFKIELEVCYDEKPLREEPTSLGMGGYKLNNNTTCLLVDDVPMNLKVLSASLQKLNIKTLTAASGLQALELIRTEKVDIILTDLWMPGMDGAQFAEIVRDMPECKSIPIIAVTADVASHDNFEMKYFNGILTKPVTVNKLLSLFIRTN